MSGERQATGTGGDGRGVRRPLVWAALLLGLSALTVWRITRTATSVDFLHYMSVTRAMADSADLYAYTGEHVTDFPPYGIFFAPFLVLGPGVQEFVFLAINLAAASALILLIFRPSGAEGSEHPPPVPLSGWLIALVGIALINTAPMMQALRQGQVSVLVSFLLILALLGRRSRAGPLWLATAMMLKYSSGLFALLALVKRGPAFCVAAFLLFLLWAVSPALVGADLTEAYSSYFESIERSFGPDGINNPEVHGSNLVHLGFFRPDAINWIGRGLMIVVFLLVLRKERKRDGLGLEALLVTASLGMAVSYHRLYDLVILVPLLGALAACSWTGGRRWHFACALGFLLFFLVPQSLWNRIAAALGGMVGEIPFLVMGMDTRTSSAQFFPIYGIGLLLLCIWSVHLYFSTEGRPRSGSTAPAADPGSC